MIEVSRTEAIKALMRKSQDELDRGNGELRPPRVLYAKSASLHERLSLQRQRLGSKLLLFVHGCASV